MYKICLVVVAFVFCPDFGFPQEYLKEEELLILSIFQNNKTSSSNVYISMLIPTKCQSRLDPYLGWIG